MQLAGFDCDHVFYYYYDLSNICEVYLCCPTDMKVRRYVCVIFFKSGLMIMKLDYRYVCFIQNSIQIFILKQHNICIMSFYITQVLYFIQTLNMYQKGYFVVNHTCNNELT